MLAGERGGAQKSAGIFRFSCANRCENNGVTSPRTITRAVRRGAVHFSNLSGLEELDLHRSPVTDARLRYFEGLTDLQSLTLFHTPISDTGLAHLKRLHRLRTLSIENTSVTDSGAQELQKALPKLSIMR